MASSSSRRRRSTAAIEFTAEVGHPIACLWILRLLQRGGAKMLRLISDHTALVQHLGSAIPTPTPIPVLPKSGGWDEDDEDDEDEDDEDEDDEPEPVVKPVRGKAPAKTAPKTPAKPAPKARKK